MKPSQQDPDNDFPATGLQCCCLCFAQLCPVFPLLPLHRLPRPNCMTAPAEKDLQLSCCPTGDSSLAADQLQLNPGLVAAGMLLVRSQPDHFEGEPEPRWTRPNLTSDRAQSLNLTDPISLGEMTSWWVGGSDTLCLSIYSFHCYQTVVWFSPPADHLPDQLPLKSHSLRHSTNLPQIDHRDNSSWTTRQLWM